MYVFDNGPFSKLKHFYPNVFPSVWTNLDKLIKNGKLFSTKEVWNELERGGTPPDFLKNWLKDNKSIFRTPSLEETLFVAEILKVPHFQQLIGKQQQLKGTPVADPFIIACAKIHNATLVTEELFKPNSAKIPTICKHFGNIPCITLEEFMAIQNWSF